MKRIGVAGVALAAVFFAAAVAASAETTTTICVPEASSKPVLSTDSKGECPTKGTKPPISYKSVQLPGTGGLETLGKILPHINYLETGVGGKPTIQFSGVNVEIVNGEGKTASVNGKGNLVIGYDENASRTQTGSHDLILGEEQAFSSFGGIVAGFGNTISGREASVTGGAVNTASGFYTSVTGGMHNIASVEAASVQGGSKNIAQARFASIFGGKDATALNEYEAIP
jgi:hypothetical protein